MRTHIWYNDVWLPLVDKTHRSVPPALAAPAPTKYAKGWVYEQGTWVPIGLSAIPVLTNMGFGWVSYQGEWIPIFIPELPPKPVGLRGGAIGETSIQVLWNPAAKADWYRVDVSPDPSTPGPFPTVAPDLTITGLTASTTYTITIMALNAYGESESSTIQLTTAAAYVPPPPLPTPAPPTWVYVTKTGPSTGLLQWGHNGYWGYLQCHIIKEGDNAHALTETPSAYDGQLELRNAPAGHSNVYRIRFFTVDGYWTEWTWSNWVTWG